MPDDLPSSTAEPLDSSIIDFEGEYLAYYLRPAIDEVTPAILDGQAPLLLLCFRLMEKLETAPVIELPYIAVPGELGAF